MARASASEAVDSGVVPSRVKPITFLVFTASRLDAKHKRDSVEYHPVISLIVPLGKALSEITPSQGGKQMAGNF